MRISLGRGTCKVVTKVTFYSIQAIAIDSGIGTMPVDDIIRMIFGPSVRFID